MCIGLTTTDEKIILTFKKNTIKIHAKLYESATSHFNLFCYFVLFVQNITVMILTMLWGEISHDSVCVLSRNRKFMSHKLCDFTEQSAIPLHQQRCQ